MQSGEQVAGLQCVADRCAEEERVKAILGQAREHPGAYCSAVNSVRELAGEQNGRACLLRRGEVRDEIEAAIATDGVIDKGGFKSMLVDGSACRREICREFDLDLESFRPAKGPLDKRGIGGFVLHD